MKVSMHSERDVEIKSRNHVDADELEWYIPAAILVEELQRTLNVINQFLQAPINLDGKEASQLLSKKRRRRRRRSPSPASDDDATSADEPRRKKRKEKKKKEKEMYKSAQFIEDSDVEYGDMEAFLEKEKAARERAILAAEAAGTDRPATMKPTGTKKRRRNVANRVSKPKTRPAKHRSPNSDDEGEEEKQDNEVQIIETSRKSSPLPRPRPRPKPRLRKKNGASESEAHADGGVIIPEQLTYELILAGHSRACRHFCQYICSLTDKTWRNAL
jgi:replication fork protection complex subunit Tof1/Swi1